MADTTYRVWDEDETEADGEDVSTDADTPRDAATVYVEERTEGQQFIGTTYGVSVRNKTTNELTRWIVTVDYEPTFTARLRAGEVP
jgi:hypothetical protein